MTPAANLDRRSPPPVPAMSIPSLLTLPRAGHPWGRPSRRRSNPPSIRTVAPRSSDNNEDFLTSLRESPKYERRDAGTAQDLSRCRPDRLDPGRGDGPRRDRALGVRRHHRAEPGAGSPADRARGAGDPAHRGDRKSTRLNSSHVRISYAVFCLKKKKKK